MVGVDSKIDGNNAKWIVGAWVSYFGGSFDADNGTINYDQDVNGIMVGVDSKIDGNNAKWIVGA
ncbi:hypothetical protein C6977_28045, partial [Escherichia coli]